MAASISALLPSCGGPRFLELALESLANQRGVTYEVIVCNASPDPMPALRQRYQTRMELVWIDWPDVRRGVARNSALARASGDAVVVLSDDHLLAPDCLAHVAGEIERERGVVVFPQQGILTHWLPQLVSE